MKLPAMVEVKSSNIQKVGYSDRDGLFVRFVDGGLYSYPDAPKSVFDEIVTAESPGKVFREKARHYAHRRHDNA